MFHCWLHLNSAPLKPLCANRSDLTILATVPLSKPNNGFWNDFIALLHFSLPFHQRLYYWEISTSIWTISITNSPESLHHAIKVLDYSNTIMLLLTLWEDYFICCSGVSSGLYSRQTCYTVHFLLSFNFKLYFSTARLTVELTQMTVQELHCSNPIWLLHCNNLRWWR